MSKRKDTDVVDVTPSDMVSDGWSDSPAQPPKQTNLRPLAQRSSFADSLFDNIISFVWFAMKFAAFSVCVVFALALSKDCGGSGGCSRPSQAERAENLADQNRADLVDLKRRLETLEQQNLELESRLRQVAEDAHTHSRRR